MLSTRSCVFCGVADIPMSQEHLWSDWMRDLIPGSRSRHPAVEHRIETFEQVERTFAKRPFTATTGGVCEPCNNGWMSDWENGVKPILVPLITRGAAVELSVGDCAILARWLVLKALVFQLSTNVELVPQNHYRYLHDHKRPHPDTQAWIGARIGRKPESILGLKGLAMGQAREDPNRFNAYFMPIVIGNFVAEVFGHDFPLDYRFIRVGDYAPALKAIWPVSGPVEWPPPNLVIDVDGFAKDRSYQAAVVDGLREGLAKRGITLDTEASG